MKKYKTLADCGRNGDTTLMHIAPQELQGLSALLGPVTINPKTGLPEAFSWKKLLAGIGLGIAAIPTGGASLAGALAMAGGLPAALGTAAALGGASRLVGSAIKPSQTRKPDEGSAEEIRQRSATEAARMINIPLMRNMVYGTPQQYAPGVSPEHVRIAPTVIGFASPSQNLSHGGRVTKGLGSMARKRTHQGLVRSKTSGLADAVPMLNRSTGKPTMLSGGEYVIPADVVSRLGDGNTMAGSSMLDNMTKAVRNA